MSVTFDWYNDEKSVVKFIFIAPWTIEEMAECENHVRSEMKTFNHVVDAIFDCTHAPALPKSALSYFTSSVNKGKTLKNEGVTVVYGANMFVRMIGNSIRKIVKTDVIYFAESLEEVEDILTRIKLNRDSQ